MDTTERNRLLTLPDRELLAHCRVECFRGSGPGGQHRNVTDSAVRITHPATGVTATAVDTRSQQTNRGLAVRRLRVELALACRAPAPAPWSGAWKPPRRSVEYPVWIATVLDVLAGCGWRVSDAAAAFALSTGRFVRDLAADRDLWQAVNAGRRQAGLAPLRA